MTRYEDLDARDSAFVNELGAGNKTVVSAQLVRALNGNGNAAIFLSQLLWWGRRHEGEDGWFYRTRDSMQQRCGLGKHAQKSAEDTLTDLGVIEKEVRGMPATLHYRIKYDLVLSLLEEDQQDRGLTREQDRGLTPEQDRGDARDQDILKEEEEKRESPRAQNSNSNATRAHEEPASEVVEALRNVRDAAPRPEEMVERIGEDWPVRMYEAVYDDYNVPIFVQDKWQQEIDRPALWAQAILRGLERGWQPNSTDARTDTYRQLAEQETPQGEGASTYWTPDEKDLKTT